MCVSYDSISSQRKQNCMKWMNESINQWINQPIKQSMNPRVIAVFIFFSILNLQYSTVQYSTVQYSTVRDSISIPFFHFSVFHFHYFLFFILIIFSFLIFPFFFAGSLLTYLYPDHNGTRQVFAVDLPSTKGSTGGLGVNHTADPAEFGSLGKFSFPNYSTSVFYSSIYFNIGLIFDLFNL